MSITSPFRFIVKILGSGLVLTILVLSSAYAASLDQAKKAGMVCELPTGYLQATGSATTDVKAMVQDINSKRKAEYTRIANENGVKPEDVGILTGKKLGPKCR